RRPNNGWREGQNPTSSHGCPTGFGWVSPRSGIGRCDRRVVLQILPKTLRHRGRSKTIHRERAQIHSDQYGQACAAVLAENAKPKLGREPKDIKIAIIHEDGPYWVSSPGDGAIRQGAGLVHLLHDAFVHA